LDRPSPTTPKKGAKIRKFRRKLKDGKGSSCGNGKESKKERCSIKDEENVKYKRYHEVKGEMEKRRKIN
jgi:hypothetical protein